MAQGPASDELSQSEIPHSMNGPTLFWKITVSHPRETLFWAENDSNSNVHLPKVGIYKVITETAQRDDAINLFLSAGSTHGDQLRRSSQSKNMW